MGKQAWLFAVAVMGIGICGWAGWWLTRQEDRPEISPATAIAGTETAPAIDPVTQLIKNLASRSASDRDRGAKALEATTTRNIRALREAAVTADEPTAALIRKRLEVLDELAATDPPPISLNVKDASLAAVCQALTKATGTTILYTYDNRELPARYTFAAKDEPFWKVIADLNRQGAMTPLSAPSGWGFRSGAPGGTEPGEAAESADFTPHQSFVAYSTGVRTTLPAFSSVKLAPDEIQLVYAVAADPRLRVAAAVFGPHDVTVDGQPVTITRTAVPPARVTPNLWQPTLTIRMTDQIKGKKAKINVMARFTIVLKSEMVEVSDPEKHAKESFTVGDEVIRLDSFRVQDQRINYGVGKQNQEAQVEMTIVDDDGQSLGKTVISGAASSGFRTVTVPFKLPLKVRFSVPTKTKSTEVPLEIQNIPLP